MGDYVTNIPSFKADDGCGGQVCQERPYGVGNLENVDRLNDGRGIVGSGPCGDEIAVDSQSQISYEGY